MTARKLQSAFALRSIGELETALDNNQWLYWGDRPKHPSIFLGMTLRTLKRGIKAGSIRYAVNGAGCFYRGN